MIVSLDEIKQIFEELIKEKKTREQISAWAKIRQQANDTDELEYEPANEKNRIWRSIKYLLGVDLRDIDGSYLHSLENLIEFRKELKF